MNQFAKIVFSSSTGKNLEIRITANEYSKTAAINIDKINSEVESYLYIWLVVQSRALFERMPIQKFEVTIEDRARIYMTPINSCLMQIKNTNNKLKELSIVKRKCLEYKKTLIFKPDDHRYADLFSYASECLEQNIEYLYEPLPFDPIKRVWFKKDLNHTISDIIEIILSKKIRNICVVNHDPLLRYSSTEAINIFCVLHFIGCKVINIQNDPKELGLNGSLNRALHFEGSVQFINQSVLDSGMKNIDSCELIRAPLMQDFREKERYIVGPSTPSKRIVVLTNSRFNNVIENRSNIQLILENLENPITDLSLWYLSVNKLIDNKSSWNELKTASIKRLLHNLFYHSANYMKHKIIWDVQDILELEVYGDEGWKHICPQNYRGHIQKDEYYKLFSCQNVVFLLMNYGYTYLDHSGPVYDMISHRSNWINVPVIAKSNGLDNLKFLEYSHADNIKTFYPTTKSEKCRE